jgi:hypothetical protein
MLLRSLSAEALKYRRHATLWLAIGVPLSLGLLMILAFTLAESLREADPARKWALMQNQLVPMWAILVLPLGTSILAALATGLETADNHLKQVLVLPPSRSHTYSAKVIAILAIVLAGTLTLSLVMAAVGLVLGFAQPVPWRDLFEKPLIAYLGGLPTLALSAWLGLRFRSFAVPVGVGLAGSIAGSLAVRSGTYWLFVPWTYPMMVLGGTNGVAIVAALLSVILFTLLALGGAVDFQRRDVQ